MPTRCAHAASPVDGVQLLGCQSVSPPAHAHLSVYTMPTYLDTIGLHKGEEKARSTQTRFDPLCSHVSGSSNQLSFTRTRNGAIKKPRPRPRATEGQAFWWEPRFATNNAANSARAASNIHITMQGTHMLRSGCSRTTCRQCLAKRPLTAARCAHAAAHTVVVST